MSRATDTHRVAKAHTPLGGKLVFREIQGREELSRLFEYRVELLAEEDSTVDPKALLGLGITIEIEIQGGGSRYIDAQCNRFAYIGHETAEMRNTKFYRYEARLVPWVWYMTLASNSRVFQNRAVPDIIREVFDRYPGAVDYRLSRSYREWEYCVQYHETDFNFVSRLMEHEGIGYFFEHAMGTHTLVLFDDVGALSSLPGYASIPHLFTDKMVVPDEEWIDHWRMAQEVDSGRYVTDDYDFKFPQPHLRTTRSNEGPYANSDYEIYDWPGGYVKVPHGEQYARLRLEELQQTKELVSGQSDVRGLTPGYLFTLTRCPRRDQNREYLILGVTCFLRDNPYHSGAGGPSDWQFTLFAQPSTLPYRPVRRTTKPRTMGPQTAVVVGLKSNRDEEIVCDEHGRVRVQFHWDRYHSYDEDSSCWIRVASGWAGSNWGQITIPRVNQEVLVDFIDGDPDYPIITGRVYNGEHKPPYALPRWKEYSTWKSRSTKHGGNNDWNEIRFYDYKGKEQVFIQAQWRMDVRVKWNKYLTVKENWHSLIGGGYYLTMGANYDLHVKGKVFERADGDINLSAGGDIKVVGDKNVQTTSSQATELTAGTDIVLDAGMQITLKASGGFITIGPSGVTIQGTMVLINSGGAAGSASDYDADRPYDASEADHGEPGYLDKPPKAQGWGKRGSSKGGPGSRGGGAGPNPLKGGGGAADPGSEKYSDGITIKGDKAYRDAIRKQLDALKEKPAGKKLIDELDRQGREGKGVTIKHDKGASPGTAAQDSDARLAQSTTKDPTTGKVTVVKPGKGTSSTVDMPADLSSEFPALSKYPDGTAAPPNQVPLGHELIHAMHNGDGTNLRSEGFDGDPSGQPSNHEEAQTMGIGPYAGDEVTENALRKEAGHNRPRKSHATYP